MNTGETKSQVGQLFMCVVRAPAHLIRNTFGITNANTNTEINTNTYGRYKYKYLSKKEFDASSTCVINHAQCNGNLSFKPIAGGSLFKELHKRKIANVH